MYRTFIKLGDHELAFIRRLQNAAAARRGMKGKPPMSQVIRGVLLDYEAIIDGKAGITVGVNPGTWGPT